MVDLAALDRLIDAVECGVRLPMDGSAYRLFGDGWLDVFDAYHGSLDAAKALHEALLPGWWWSAFSSGQAVVSEDSQERFHSRSSTPARAWLIAILKAYRAQVAA